MERIEASEGGMMYTTCKRCTRNVSYASKSRKEQDPPQRGPQFSGHTKSPRTLRKMVLEGWKQLSQDTINSWIDSTLARLQAVIDRDGQILGCSSGRGFVTDDIITAYLQYERRLEPQPQPQRWIN